MTKNSYYRRQNPDQRNGGYRRAYNPSQGRNRSQKNNYRNAKRNKRPQFRRWGNGRNLNAQWNSNDLRIRVPDHTPYSPPNPPTTPVIERDGPGNTPPFMGSPRIIGSPRIESPVYSPSSPAYGTTTYSNMPLVLSLQRWNEKMETEKGRSVLDSNEFKTVWKLHVAENGVIDETKGPVHSKEWNEDTEMSREQFEFIRDRCASKIIEKEKEDLCKICLVKKRTHIYPQCGHFCICSDCKLEQEGRGDLTCPMCRTVNTKIQRVFM